MQDLAGKVTTLNSLGELAMLRKDYSNVLTYLNEAEKLAIQTGKIDDLGKNFSLKTSYFRKIGDYQEALNYSEKLHVIEDSLLNRDKFNQLLRVRVRYEADKAQQQLDLKQTEIEAKKFWISTLFIGMILLAIIGSLIYAQLKSTKTSKKKIELLLKELHHRVKNNLQLLSSLFSLQAKGLTNEQAIVTMKSTQGRINAMNLIHKKLYQGNENQTVNLKSYFTELVDFLAYTYAFNGHDKIINCSIENIDLDVDKSIPLGLIANELISNAFKYAFQKQAYAELNIELTRNTGELVLAIRDNGPGISDEVPSPTSFGLKMVRELVGQLKGTISLINQGGTAYIITIPL